MELGGSGAVIQNLENYKLYSFVIKCIVTFISVIDEKTVKYIYEFSCRARIICLYINVLLLLKLREVRNLVFKWFMRL